MSRRLSDAFAADASGILASVVIFVLAFGVWRLTGVRKTADGTEAGTVGKSDGGLVTPTRVESADIGGSGAKKPEVRKGPFNVILITVDTLRADIGFMGYPRPVSTNIDALAQRGVVFEHAYSMASFTPKCLGPLLIGRYVSETVHDYEHYTNFPPANVFLAERVTAAGGKTFGIASHRYFGMKKGFEQGFDIFDTSAIPPNSTDNESTPTSEKVTDIAIGLLSPATKSAAEIPSRTRSPVTVVREGPSKNRFFAWIHYLDPHLPYVGHPGAPNFAALKDGIRAERAAYDGEVWFTDQHIGRLLNHITAQPWANETVIIFTADHGEAFGEHGHWGHGRELWEPLIHVPLILYIPGTPARRVPVKRSHIDIVPTIMELMGIAPDATLHGKSLVADTRNPIASLEERDLYFDMPEGPFNDLRRAIITGPSPGTKLIDLGAGNRYELYDLKADPNETKNLSGDTAKLNDAKAALSRLRATMKELPPIR